MSKQKDLGRSLEHRVANRARAKGLEAKRQPGSGMFQEAPHDVTFARILGECKVRSYTTNAKGEDSVTFPISALRKVQASAIKNEFEQGVLIVNAKGNHNPFILMDLDWFLGVLAQRERYHDALKQIVDGVDADSPPISAFWLQNIAALALDESENPL